MKNYTITVNGNVYDVTVEEVVKKTVPVTAKPAPVVLKEEPKIIPKVQPAVIAPVVTETPKVASQAGTIKVESGASGKVFKLEVNVGQMVKRGDPVVIIEAMKMEIPVVSPEDGTIASIEVAVGDAIEAGETLVTLN